MIFQRLLLTLAFFLVATTGWAQSQRPAGEPETAQMHDVGSGGEFKTSVDIRIPDYRGLPLPVSLSYSSSNTSRGGADNLVGFGWTLNAFSSIERRSLGGGIPTFDNGQDLFVMDGQELMACADSNATNPWTGYYPYRYQTDVRSASCLAGGNFSTRVESYLKIRFDEASNRFFVNRKDGTQLTYVAIGDLVADSSTTGSDLWNVAHNSRWLLTEVRDTQATANTVSYSYSFGTSSQGYAPRLTMISYGGYSVRFGYRTFTEVGARVPTFATGTLIDGQNNWQLRSIQVADGTQNIRAYQLAHTASALSGAQLVTSVTEYGSDFTISGSDVASGSSLPPTSFTYSDDTVGFTSTTFSGSEFHETVNVVDWNRDGSDELLLGARVNVYRWTDSSDDDQERVTHSYAPGLFDFGADRSLASLSHPPQTCQDSEPGHSNNVTRLNEAIGPIRLLNDVRPGGDRLCFTQAIRDYDNNSGDEFRDFVLETRNLETSGNAHIDQLTGHYHSGTLPGPDLLVWNMDLDPEDEIFLDNRLYQVAKDGSVGPGQPAANLAVDGEWKFASDFSGDGVVDYVAGIYNVRILPEPGTFNGVAHGYANTLWTNISGSSPFLSYHASSFVEFLGYGDMDGDGLSDIVFHRHNDNSADTISYVPARGRRFGAEQTISLGHNLLSRERLASVSGYARYENHKSRLSDINGDGLTDIVVHSGHNYANRYNDPYSSAAAWVFVNTGTGFQLVNIDGASTSFDGLVATGDFDGNGRLDFAVEGADGRIIFGDGALPNRMTSVQNSSGGTLEVTYTSSTNYGVNEIPGIQNVVEALTRDDGRGNRFTTTYSYSGGKYDFVSRAPLGYQTITAQLPSITGETEGPRVVTTYLNEHISERGKVASRVVIQGSTTLEQETNFYTNNYGSSTNGPYRTYLNETRNATRYGANLIETTKRYEFNRYGEPTLISELGFANSATGQDDRSTVISYRPNLANYVVNRPEWKAIVNGTSGSWSDPSNYLQSEYYTYDENPGFAYSPTRGNLVRIQEWTGDPASHARRVRSTFSYDSYGNVLTETDALGNSTSHTYENTKNLFRTQTTNALSHAVTTSWNTGCQLPMSQVDANALTTNFTYDEFCRETRQEFPRGQNIWTDYRSFGDPSAQHVRTRTYSASTVSGMRISESREYFDGFGRSFRSVAPGERDLQDYIEDGIVVLKEYDARGNIAFESVPQPWNTASTSVGTSFSYDGLNRLTQSLNPDSSYSTLEYTSSAFATLSGQNTFWPEVISRDEHCFDAASENTICGYSRTASDSRGNTIRLQKLDLLLSDSDAGGSTERDTYFGYDNLDRLAAVQDASGENWSYTYDSFGNRILSDDPSLGAWSMQYDANGNLTLQTDAAGGTIEFSYDSLNRVTLKRVGSGDTRVDTHYAYDEIRSGFFNTGNLTTQRVWTSADGYYHTIAYNYLNDGNVGLESHTLDGLTYDLSTTYRANGQVRAYTLPFQAGSVSTQTLPDFQYDAASRLTSFGTHISSATYNEWNNPTRLSFGNGAYSDFTYDSQRGWVSQIEVRNSAAELLEQTVYSRTATGRVAEQQTFVDEGWHAYQYDYAGRLLSVTNLRGVGSHDQSFTFNRAGSLSSNNQLGDYAYGSNQHAPVQVNLLTPYTAPVDTGSGGTDSGTTDPTALPSGNRDYSAYTVVEIPEGGTASKTSGGQEIVYAPDDGLKITVKNGQDILIEGDITNRSIMVSREGDDEYVIKPIGNEALIYGFVAGGSNKVDLSLFGNTLNYGDLSFSNDHAWLYVTVPGHTKEILIRLPVSTQPEADAEAQQFSASDFMFYSDDVSFARNSLHTGETSSGGDTGGTDTGSGGTSTGGGTLADGSRDYSAFEVIEIPEGGTAPKTGGGNELVYGPDDGIKFEAKNDHDILVEGAVTGRSTIKGHNGDDEFVVATTGTETLIYGVVAGATGKVDLSLFGNDLSYADLTFSNDHAWLYVTVPGHSKEILIRLPVSTQPEADAAAQEFSASDFMFYSDDMSFARNSLYDDGSSGGGTGTGGDGGGSDTGSGGDTGGDTTGGTTFTEFQLTYDANGNMLTGLYGKVMTYDGENRPLSVTLNGVTTRYIYGADGSRLKLIDNAGTADETVTLTFGIVEIRNYGQGSDEIVITYPHSNVRFVNGEPSYMHRDQLDSVRLISDQNGTATKRSIYKPFGEVQEWTYDILAADEAKGFIGERYDAGAGLQYLNARYYDPELGMFIQPDWFEVTELGVGTNRYSYSFNDPVNAYDPGGNEVKFSLVHQGSTFQRNHFLAIGGGGSALNLKGALPSAAAITAAGNILNSTIETIDLGKGGFSFETAGPSVLANPIDSGAEFDGSGLLSGSTNTPETSFSNVVSTPYGAGEINITVLTSGSYTIDFPDGTSYHGKGPMSRAISSAKRIAKRNGYEIGENLIDWTSAPNDREAFKQEDDRIQSDGGVENPNNHNKINSPGRKYNEMDK